MLRRLVAGLNLSNRFWMAVTLCAAVCLFSGCIQDNTVINIKPDGSGTIEETVLMGNSFIDMMEGMTRGMTEAKAQDDASPKEKPKSDDKSPPTMIMRMLA